MRVLERGPAAIPSGDVPRPVGRTTRVFVVDDFEMVRRGLRDLLESEGDLAVVGEAGDVGAAVRAIPAARPDVVVVDHRLPDGRGVEVVPALRRGAAPVPWVLLTGYDDDEEALLSAVRHGASAVLLKRVAGGELLHVVRRVAAGETLIDEELRSRAAESSSSAERDRLQTLTPREREVLGLIGEGLTNRQVAERLVLSEKTVKNHVTGLLSKLQMSRRTQAAALVTRRNLA